MTAGAIKTQLLSRRLLANHLLFGLLSLAALATGLVLIVGFAIDPTDGSRLLARLGAVVVLPLILLLLGGLNLNKVVKSSSAIERQLARLAAETPASPMQLTPVEERGPAAIGWNRLVSRSMKGQLLDNLQARLSESLGGCRQEKYEHILQGLTDGVAATNEEGIVTFANKAFTVLLNADPQTVCGSAVEQIVLQYVPNNADKFRLQMQEPSRPSVVEIQQSDDVAAGVLRLARCPLRSDDGRTLTQVWSVRDITQQRLVELKRDQLIDTATHELRTPLTTITACAEALESAADIDLESQREYLHTMRMEATRLGRFVDEFLNISRMEAGSLSINLDDIDFERLLSEVVEKVRPQMEQKQIDFQVLLPPKIPHLNLDRDKISAAIVNLLSNAAKYTPAAGRVTLQVEIGKGDIRVHVEDSGIGIAADELPKVFNKFFRSDDDRVHDITDTGLGLAFAQEVVRLHGGKITAQSEIEHGSRFTLSLPLG